MSDPRWMLYGANGYTGKLIAEEAERAGDKPILAGRREQAIRPIAERHGFEYRVFSLDSPSAIAEQLSDFSAILLAAGPFSKTSAPVVDACLATGTHYLDITGEIGVFEACHALDAEAVRAGCALLPGVGFDVVPTDCLAAALGEALPGATELELAFHGGGSLSQGTAKTSVESLPNGGAIRKDGRIETVPIAWKSADIPFRDQTRRAVSIPWGDVSTAYYSTGIPNIVVYLSSSPKMIRNLKLARTFRRVLATNTVQKFLKRQIEKRVKGPDAEERRRVTSQIWGRVAKAGASIEGTLVTPEGYALTVVTALEATRRAVAGKVEPGAKTPSMAFGSGFITEFDGCDMQIGG